MRSQNNAGQVQRRESCVKEHPLLMTEPKQRGIDVTNADISMAQFFKKLDVREITRVNQWEATRHMKPLLQNAEREFDIHLKSVLGLHPELLMLGNYTCQMFALEHHTSLLLVTDHRC